MDALGDRMKAYEAQETKRSLLPLIPVYARIDGRSFSRFTKGMVRPYDSVMSNLMISTTKRLVEGTQARIGYTQSDEISLVWLADDPKSEMFFAGKVQKMASVLASMATAAFIRTLLTTPYADRVDMLPQFDARVFNLPTKTEAANAILWREKDATKNAISMAARAFFSHKELQGKKGAEMQEMLFTNAGVNFNDYPDFFKRGTFVRRIVEERTLTDSERDRIPEAQRPTREATFTRTRIDAIPMPRFGSVTNREAVIFDAAEPELES